MLPWHYSFLKIYFVYHQKLWILRLLYSHDFQAWKYDLNYCSPNFFMPFDVCDGLWDVRNMACLRCRTFKMWDFRYVRRWDVECSRCGVFGMKDTRDVGCLGCGSLGMWDVGNVRCSGCVMFGMWDVRDVLCLGYEMWNVGCWFTKCPLEGTQWTLL